MSLTIPNTFSNGATISASQMNANFDAVAAKFAGGAVTTTELEKPYSYVNVTFFAACGNLVAGTYRAAHQIPGSDTFIPVQCEAYYYSTAGSPSLSLQGSNGTTNLLNSALTMSSGDANTVKVSTDFLLTSVAAGAELTMTLTLTTATIVDVRVSVTFKVLHKA